MVKLIKHTNRAHALVGYRTCACMGAQTYLSRHVHMYVSMHILR